jgi:Putative adhesin
MNRTLALTGMFIALCAGVSAQDPNSDRVVVPARNSTRPRKLDVSLMSGTITVKAYAGKEVIVEASAASSASRKAKVREKESARDAAARADGLHRLDAAPRGLTVEENDNLITVRVPGHSASLTISVPVDTSLTLHTMSGHIEVDGVKGEFELNSMNGSITLNGVSGSVLAHSMNGAIKVSMDSVDQKKPLSFSTMNGTIDVTLPADFKSNVKLRTDHGAIYSDFEFKLGPGVITQKNDTPDGKFRVKMDSTISGAINGGGVEATFKTYNGTIYIRKKK